MNIIQQTNIPIVGVLEGEKREKRTERIFEEIMGENFPNLIKDRKLNKLQAG